MHPTLVPQGHLLAAVVGDIIDLARDILAGCPTRMPGLGEATGGRGPLELAPLSEVRRQYYLRFTAQNQPGVLAAISRVLGEHHISIEAVLQKGWPTWGPVPIVMLTHEAKEADAQAALKVTNALPVIV